MQVSYRQLRSAATALADVAGVSPATNSNMAGQWRAFAEAAEALAASTSSANTSPVGYMRRSAVALEALSGTSGAEENPTEQGLLKRIVDALEARAGGPTAGPIGVRLQAAAEATPPVDRGIVISNVADTTVAPSPDAYRTRRTSGAGTAVDAVAKSDSALADGFRLRFMRPVTNGRLRYVHLTTNPALGNAEGADNLLSFLFLATTIYVYEAGGYYGVMDNAFTAGSKYGWIERLPGDPEIRFYTGATRGTAVEWMVPTTSSSAALFVKVTAQELAASVGDSVEIRFEAL